MGDLPLRKPCRWNLVGPYGAPRHRGLSVTHLLPARLQSLLPSLSCKVKVNSVVSSLRLEWVAIPFSRGSSRHRDWTQVCIPGRGFNLWATREWVPKGGFKQLLIKGGTAKKPPDTRLNRPEKLIKIRGLTIWDEIKGIQALFTP